MCGPRRAWTVAEQAQLELQRPARSEAEREARAIGGRHGGDSGAALREFVQALGHAGGQAVPTVSGALWFGMCSCGWVCPQTYRTQASATGALIHHVRLAVREWHRSGLPLAAARKAPSADSTRAARRHRHYAAWRASVAEEVPPDHIRRVG
jgi:hypothetical protein